MGEARGRALVVGVPGATLRAVDRDVRAMTDMLHERGFVVDERTGAQATRSGILAAYDALIDGVQRDEPAVFYYAGHGFHAVADHGPLRTCQGICPFDLDATSTDDFRGITAWELSIKLAELTQRTKKHVVSTHKSPRTRTRSRPG